MTVQRSPYQDTNSYLLVEKLANDFAENEQDKANISIVSAGQGAENSLLGMLNFSWYVAVVKWFVTNRQHVEEPEQFSEIRK